ncbi:hypothetical protein [Borrelia persica]|uniref:hypothetical protein n=1 Tax=Borrelia persica TaxID=44448 RepID=UPI0004B6B8F7|nr:hypothetical protein [Borrelia persica]
MGLINQDKAEVEDASQYGMKDEVFKLVLNEVNDKTLDLRKQEDYFIPLCYIIKRE